MASFAISQGLAGVHYWSYDRDVDCAPGSASATCNSMGNGYAGPHGYLEAVPRRRALSQRKQGATVAEVR